jgi:putative transposase
MKTYTQILYQIVFSTKNRERTLSKDGRANLYDYICGVLYKSKCHPYRINGVEDHIHIATHIHPQVALSDLVKNIKLATNDYIKNARVFRNFSGWQSGYSAFTYSHRDKPALIQYILNQEAHHRTKTFIEELKELLEEHGIEFDERFLA